MASQCVFQHQTYHVWTCSRVEKDVTTEEVNAALKEAAEWRIKRILDYNELPLSIN